MRVHHLRNTLLAATLAKKYTGGGCVGENVASDRLAAISTSEERTRARIRLDLIGHEDGNVELFCELGKLAKVLSKLLLTLAELSTAGVVTAEEVENAVNDEQAIVASCEVLGHAAEDLVLVLAVLGTVNDDVLDGLLWVDCDRSVGVIRSDGSLTHH